MAKAGIKGCVRYIFASLFLSLNESTSQTRKNIFYITSRALFILDQIKLLNPTFLKFYDVIKCLSIKQDIPFMKQLVKQTQSINEI